MKKCKNETCTQEARTLYCSRRCTLTARNAGHRGQLPDIWVGMDTERALVRRAETLNLTVRDLIVNLLEAEIETYVGPVQLDFGERLNRVANL